MSQHPNQNLRVLISGCGRIGGQLGLLLARRGHTVWGIRRRPDLMPEQILPLRGDLALGEGLELLPPALDFVFHFSSARAQSEKAYSLGIKNLLKALATQEQQINRLFFVSSTGVYGQMNGEWVDEDSMADPAHDAGKYLLEGEARVHSSSYSGTVIRFAGIYGPGRVQLLERIGRGDASTRREACRPADGPGP